MHPLDPRDWSLVLLAGGLVFYTCVVLGVSLWMPGNQAVYTLFAGILGSFAGGLMVYLRINPPK